jgi:hypothetical protein
MILPAVALVLALGVGAVQLGAIQVRLTDAAADAARLVGRGESESTAAERVASAHQGATMSISRPGALVCVTSRATPTSALLGALFVIEAKGCALDDTAASSADAE